MPINTSFLNQTLPPWIEQMYKNMAERAEAESKSEYVPYPADMPRYAELPDDIKLAHQMGRENLGEFRAPIEEAQNWYRRGAESWPDAKARYMEPFDEEIRKLGERAARDYNEYFTPQLSQMFLGRGMENSEQHQRMAERGARNANEAFEAQKSALMRQVMQDASRNFNLDKATALEAGQKHAGTSGQLQAGKLADMTALESQGAEQMAHTQGKYNQNMADFREVRNHPWNQLSKQAGIMEGVPQPVQQYSAHQVPGTPQMNTAGNLGAIMTGLAGTAMQYGRKAGGSIRKSMNIPRLKKLPKPKDIKPLSKAKKNNGLGAMSFTQSSFAKAPKVGGKMTFKVKGVL